MKVFNFLVTGFCAILFVVGLLIVGGATFYDVKTYIPFIGSNTPTTLPSSGMFDLFVDVGGNLTILDSSGNTTTLGSGSGNGDMLKSVYDTNADNVIDLAANATHATTADTANQVANSLAFSGSPTTGHLAQIGADNTIVDGGTKVTDNASNSTYLYKDAGGNITSATLGNGLSDSAGTLSLAMTAIDGSANASITVAQMKGLGVVVSNFGQGAADVRLALPAAEFGLSGLFIVGTAQAGNHWGVLANTNDKIYLIAANGTVTAGNDNEAVIMTAAQVGQSFACWTFKTGSSAWDWLCKAISIGTSTFAAHALY